MKTEGRTLFTTRRTHHQASRGKVIMQATWPESFSFASFTPLRVATEKTISLSGNTIFQLAPPAERRKALPPRRAHAPRCCLFSADALADSRPDVLSSAYVLKEKRLEPRKPAESSIENDTESSCLFRLNPNHVRMGSSITNFVPLGWLSFTRINPSWSAMIVLTMASPSPVPCFLVEK